MDEQVKYKADVNEVPIVLDDGLVGKTVVTIGPNVDVFEVNVIRDVSPGEWKDRYKEVWRRMIKLHHEFREDGDVSKFAAGTYALSVRMGDVLANGGSDKND